MKLGKDMEMNKTNMVIQPIVEKKTTNYFKVAFFVLLIVLAVGAVAITAVYVGGKLSSDAFKEAADKYRFHTTDGETIDETITLTETEEDISFEDGSRIIFDYSKGFMVMKVTEGENVACFVANFERRDTHAPTADKLKQMKLDNLTISDEIDYYIDRSSPADPSILSERSRKACEGADVYWITTNENKDTNGRRQKRGWFRRTVSWFRRSCKTVCYPTCCWGFQCRVQCTF